MFECVGRIDGEIGAGIHVMFTVYKELWDLFLSSLSLIKPEEVGVRFPFSSVGNRLVYLVSGCP